jgi:hypothetical protein
MAPNYGHGRLAATPRTPRTPRKREEAPEVDPCANVACCGFSGLGTVSGFDAFLKGGWSSLFLAEDMLDQMLLEEAVGECSMPIHLFSHVVVIRSVHLLSPPNSRSFPAVPPSSLSGS